MAEDKTLTPPYGVFATFKNGVEQLSQGVPNQIDRSVFPGMAWNAQNQIMIGFKFLELVDEDGKPTPALHDLAVPDEPKRKAQLAKLVRAKYADLFALDLMKTTPAELGQRVTEFYGITGDTREKAVRFFLAALAYLEIPISPLFGKSRAGNGGTPPSSRRRRNTTPRQRQVETPKPDDPSGTSRQIQLRSGGTLTVLASIDLFKLSQYDRNFVFALIDQLEKYEQDDPKP